MNKVTFVVPDDGEYTIDAADDESLMTIAVNNDVPGIEGECGGEMNCGTCHVVVDDAWVSKLHAPGAAEEEMIEFLDAPKPNSRLGCQIRMCADLGGIRVTVATD